MERAVGIENDNTAEENENDVEEVPAVLYLSQENENDQSAEEEREEERDRPEPDAEVPSRDDVDYSDLRDPPDDFMEGEITPSKVLRLICYLQFKLLEELVALRALIKQTGLTSAPSHAETAARASSIPHGAHGAHPDDAGASAASGSDALSAPDRSRTLD